MAARPAPVRVAVVVARAVRGAPAAVAVASARQAVAAKVGARVRASAVVAVPLAVLAALRVRAAAEPGAHSAPTA